MKHLRLFAVFAIFAVLSTAALALAQGRQIGNRGFNGGSYLCAIRDSNGDLMSRSVITLHDDQTLSVIDSGQEGPTLFFSSQLGSWKPAGNRTIIARAISFRFQPVSGVARTDSTLTFSKDRSQVTGTVTLTLFFPPEDQDSVEGEGEFIGTFSVAGELIEPW